MKLNPDDVIYNLSDKMLTPFQKEALSLCLKCYFSPTKLNYNKYFISMENVYSRVTECQMLKKFSDSTNYFRSSLKVIAFFFSILTVS